MFLDRDGLTGAPSPLPVPFLVLPMCRNAAQCSTGVFPSRRHQARLELHFTLGVGGHDDECVFPKKQPPNSTFIIHPAAPSSPTCPYLLLLLGLSPWTCTLEMMANPKRVGPPHPTSAQLWLSSAWCSYRLDLCIQTATSAAGGRARGTLSLARRPLSQLFHASQLRQNLAVPPLPALYTTLSLPSAANSPWDTISFPPWPFPLCWMWLRCIP